MHLCSCIEQTWHDLQIVFQQNFVLMIKPTWYTSSSTQTSRTNKKIESKTQMKTGFTIMSGEDVLQRCTLLCYSFLTNGRSPVSAHLSKQFKQLTTDKTPSYQHICRYKLEGCRRRSDREQVRWDKNPPDREAEEDRLVWDVVRSVQQLGSHRWSFIEVLKILSCVHYP